MCTSSNPFKSPYKNVFVIFLNICTINKTINVIFNQAEDSNAGHHSVKVCRFHYKSQNIARREMGNPEVEGSDAVVLEAWQVSWWASREHGACL